MNHASPSLPRLSVVGAAILSPRGCLIGQRPPGGSAGEKWEFPGGKVERGETREQALAREIEEELGLRIQVQEWAGRGEITTPETHIVLDVYFASVLSGTLERRDHLALRWIHSHEIDEVDWAKADLPILPRLRERLLAQDT